MKTNNWKPVIKDLLEILVSHHCTLLDVDDGGDELIQPELLTQEQTIEMLTEAICAVDESRLTVRCDGYPSPKIGWLDIVLGNEPFEVVSDYTCISEIEAACVEHSEKWEGKTCPENESSPGVCELPPGTPHRPEVEKNVAVLSEVADLSRACSTTFTLNTSISGMSGEIEVLKDSVSLTLHEVPVMVAYKILQILNCE